MNIEDRKNQLLEDYKKELKKVHNEYIDKYTRDGEFSKRIKEVDEKYKKLGKEIRDNKTMNK